MANEFFLLSRRGCLKIAALFFFLAGYSLAGCSGPATVPKDMLNINFDADQQGSPTSTPLPIPPYDVLSWTNSKYLTTTVVADPAGGNWLRVTPTSAFAPQDPDARRRILMAASEVFPPNVKIH